MLVIKVELWPGGDPYRAQEIGKVGLANVSMKATSDYVYLGSDDKGNVTEGTVSHERSLGFWPLVVSVVKDLLAGGSNVRETETNTVKAIGEILEKEEQISRKSCKCR